jgi:hypothetical protein
MIMHLPVFRHTHDGCRSCVLPLVGFLARAHHDAIATLVPMWKYSEPALSEGSHTWAAGEMDSLRTHCLPLQLSAKNKMTFHLSD